MNTRGEIQGYTRARSSTSFAVEFSHELITVTPVEGFDVLKSPAIAVIGDAVHEKKRRPGCDVQ